ncbi:YfiR/HmsC family protein [Postechiella marina]|uniref:YfiR/HmsC family protein n=1 Tax=Postechiella marina TaxID=943941 RepID=UPI0031D56D2F
MLPKIKFLIKGFVFILTFLYWGNTSFAQNITVPENIQAALLTKVLKYNPQTPKNKKIKILVVYNSSYQINKDEFIMGLGNSVAYKAIKPEDLEANILGYHVVYFMEGIQEGFDICKTFKVLSVTGSIQHVEQGDISLGFGIENNKPKIFVNLTSLEKEGQSFSSDILRIGKIFK